MAFKLQAIRLVHLIPTQFQSRITVKNVFWDLFLHEYHSTGCFSSAHCLKNTKNEVPFSCDQVSFATSQWVYRTVVYDLVK